jgi:hypothetical protein
MRHPTLAPAALLLCLAASVHAQSATAPAPGEKTVSLPLRQVSVYKNGVALFEQSGQVTGDTLIQIDFTTAELDDVLQSITAVDRNGGTIAGLGFDSSASVSQQLQMLGLRLGPDPTVLEFLHAIKGQTVEVQGPAGTLTGKVLNVEVHTQPDAKTGILVEHRILSLVTKASGLRSIELTPSVEVRLTGATQKQEIGRYLQLLATTRDPDVRHLILEAKGSGERTVEISYLKSVPAWKSSYRVLLNSNSTSYAPGLGHRRQYLRPGLGQRHPHPRLRRAAELHPAALASQQHRPARVRPSRRPPASRPAWRTASCRPHLSQ